MSHHSARTSPSLPCPTKCGGTFAILSGVPYSERTYPDPTNGAETTCARRDQFWSSPGLRGTLLTFGALLGDSDHKIRRPSWSLLTRELDDSRISGNQDELSVVCICLAICRGSTLVIQPAPAYLLGSDDSYPG